MNCQLVIYTVCFVFALSLVVKSTQTTDYAVVHDASEKNNLSGSKKPNENVTVISSTAAVDPLMKKRFTQDSELDEELNIGTEDNEDDWPDIPKQESQELPKNISISERPVHGERVKFVPSDETPPGLPKDPKQILKERMEEYRKWGPREPYNTEDDDEWPEKWQEAWHEYKKDSKKGLRLPSPEEKDQARESGLAKILVAQDEYMIVEVKHLYDCSMINFQEELPDNTPEMKMCSPSGKMSWQWVYPFIPGQRHTLNVYSSTSAELLYSETIKSLPMYPPPIKTARVTGGNGWIQLAFKAVTELTPNLVGYRIGYKPLVPGEETAWSHVMSSHVVFTAAVPYVRPVHPCRAFRVDRTFCVLLTDNVRLDGEHDHKLFNITIEPFRIVPDREEPLYPATYFWTLFNLTACNWLVPGDCPTIGVNKRPRPGGRHRQEHQQTPESQQEKPPHKRSRNRTVREAGNRTIPIPMAVRKMLNLPPMTTEEREAVEGPGGGDGWGGERRLRRSDSRDLWAPLLGALLGCVTVGAPLAHLLGTRYGRYIARKRWSRIKAGLESKTLAMVREAMRKKKRIRTFSVPEEKLFASFAAATATALALGRKRQSSCDMGGGGGDGAKVRRARTSSLPTPVCVTALLPATARGWRLLRTAADDAPNDEGAAPTGEAAAAEDKRSFLQRVWPLRRK